MAEPTAPREITLRPIGTIRNGHTEKPGVSWDKVVSKIVIDETYAEALDGVEEFSHIHVLFWLDQVEDERGSKMKVHPQRREDLPEVGVFATRTMFRPNPIGLTSVRLLGREKNVLRVLGLDALDGTPLLDLKPYIPRGDLWPEASGPAWLARLHEENR